MGFLYILWNNILTMKGSYSGIANIRKREIFHEVAKRMGSASNTLLKRIIGETEAITRKIKPKNSQR